MSIGLCILAIFIAFILVLLLYCHPTYPESQQIADTMEKEGRDYWFTADSNVGFIIFTGSKVNETSYAYLAKLLYDEGYTVVIPSQPFKLSMFGVKHGIQIMEEHTEVKKWILVGHSLGGVPVTRIAQKAPEYLTGIVYLASYASSDLSTLSFPALRITADNDGVMNNERMDTYADNLPAGSQSVMLEGTNHRGFGAYSSRLSHEVEADIPWQEQNAQSVNLILDFFAKQIAEAENK